MNETVALLCKHELNEVLLFSDILSNSIDQETYAWADVIMGSLLSYPEKNMSVLQIFTIYKILASVLDYANGSHQPMVI